MAKYISLVIVILMGVSGALAQQSDVASVQSAVDQAGLGVQPAVSPFSLLNSERITWSHSYSVSFFSGGNASGSAGLLNTTMLYDISSKLKLQLNLGMLHNPGALWGNGDSQAQFLPGFRLDYRPSDKVFMSIGVQTYSGYNYPYRGSGYYSRYNPFLIE
ncbi:MAG: hypothetical protein KKA42_03525 [candidate division Zixibacteria bacterium]|nr:hypothetical protein [candidate division Zixibacteria bacterium]